MKNYFTTEQWARWSNTLNSWQWPHDFPFQKPAGFDSLPEYVNISDRAHVECKYTYVTPYLYLIDLIIGHKEVLRWHWIHNLGRDNRQFEWWWFKKSVSEWVRFFGFENFYWD